MEDGTNAIQSYPNPRALTFGNVAAAGNEQHLDISPGDIRPHRIGEDRLQRGTMFRC
ncbi:hypothetical protein [Rhizobium sp. LjRoot254]|uniref:hypothetical protein n=1 Tax=Rhizobium sp. LjRoot254 TaxID=3342297 RepID=UPI003ECDC760